MANDTRSYVEKSVKTYYIPTYMYASLDCSCYDAVLIIITSINQSFNTSNADTEKILTDKKKTLLLTMPH